MSSHLSLVGAPEPPIPEGAPRDVFMDQYQEVRNNIVTLLALISDPMIASVHDDPLDQLATDVMHVCESEHQLLATLACPCPGIELSLMIDLDPDAVVTAAEVIGNGEDTSHRVFVDPGFEVFQHLVDWHLGHTRARS